MFIPNRSTVKAFYLFVYLLISDVGFSPHIMIILG